MDESKKTCCKCKVEQPLSCFGVLKSTKDGLRYDCKSCRTQYRQTRQEHIKLKNKEYFQANKDELLRKAKEYRVDNNEHIREQRREYRSRNKEHIRLKNKEYLPIRKEKIKEKRRNDKGFQLTELLRTRINKALKTNTTSRTAQKYLNCDIEIFKLWLQFMFDKDMSWDNLGQYWEVDHILPIAQFDLSRDSDREVCFNWTNLQPLKKEENKQKSGALCLHYYFNSVVSVHRFNCIHNKAEGYQSIRKSLCWLREKLRYGKNPGE
jgi:hypothetical protein